MNWASIFSDPETPRQTLQQAVKRSKSLGQDYQNFMQQRPVATDAWSALAHAANAGVKGYLAGKSERDAAKQWSDMFEQDGTGDPLFAGLTERQIQVLRDLGPEQGYSVLAEQAFKAPAESWADMTDDAGNVIGQRNSVTGEVRADPRAEQAQWAQRFRMEQDAADRRWQQELAFEREKLARSPEKYPASVQEYQFATANGFGGTYQDWLAMTKGGTSLSVGPDGQVSFQQGGGVGGKPLTEGQSKDTVYATRATGSLPLIDQYGDALASLTDKTGGSMPLVGNYLKSPEYQQAEQAGLEFLQAILRKDTGAAITEAETDQYGKVYLPQPGDSAAVLQQKAQSRKRAVEALKAGMPPQAILAAENAARRSGRGNPISAGAESAGPQPGTVEDGYRFKGGNPADPNNWEPM